MRIGLAGRLNNFGGFWVFIQIKTETLLQTVHFVLWSGNFKLHFSLATHPYGVWLLFDFLIMIILRVVGGVFLESVMLTV